jgi:hypothetical protein
MSTLVAQTISNGTVSTSSENVIQGSAKAWVNFVGSSGTRNASYNVSSVTRTTTGSYTINFTNALPDANYAVTAMVQGANSAVNSPALVSGSLATSSFSMFALNNASGLFDPTVVCVSVFD